MVSAKRAERDMSKGIRTLFVIAVVMATAASTEAQQPSPPRTHVPNVLDAVLGGGTSPEISTAELRWALSENSAIVLDARPYDEYAVSHIPGARSVRGKPGTSQALYVADVTEIMEDLPNRDQPLILYCNGLYCGRSERFAEDLAKVGYRNVIRYQLGAPGWRALGGVMQVERPALLRLLEQDKTAVLVDARAAANGKPRLRNAVNIPLSDAAKAKDDGRLPMTDHNTRIFVVADTGAEARKVAEAIVLDAFHNVAFFDGTIADLGELQEEV
jgi:rhodanese-related sulfurtransferase